MVKIFIINTGRLSESQKRKLIMEASPNKRKRYENLTNKDHIYPSLMGDYATRKLINQLYNYSFEDLIFDYNIHGKPYLKKLPDIHFNVSHSGEWVVIAFSNYRIGVDVERIRKVNLTIMSNYFTKLEQSFINRECDGQINRFFIIWTLKESFIKAIGKGFSYPIETFCVISCQLQSILGNAIMDEFMFKYLTFKKAYSLAICCNKLETELNITSLSAFEIMEES
jgi:4'-phosphopantetheinyl transferase